MATVSFDFDDTLLMTVPNEDWGLLEAGPNEQVIAELRARAAAGDTVLIVTSRSEKAELQFQGRIGLGGQLGVNIAPPRTPVLAFVAKHRLPVNSVHFTNGEDKAPTLDALGVTKHWDDDEDELAVLPPHIEGVLVPVHPLWAQSIALFRSECENPDNKDDTP